ncbi:MAG: radical SAM protein [Candidatus Omnitrophota bacterium]
MKLSDFIFYIFPKTINYQLARLGLCRSSTPITLTYSVTAACNSLCKTCQIGRHYRDNPACRENDLTLEEIEKIFTSLGHVYFFNISGGEPFLRKDLPQIIELACRHLTPKIIHTPTNALLPERIADYARQSLEIIKKHGHDIQFSIKPSIDAVGTLHDEIRGVPGNFAKLEQTIKLLKQIAREYSNFHLELGTVVSKFNLHKLAEIEDYVHQQGVESYRNEIAEQRTEFHNIGHLIAPSGEEYERLITQFKQKILKNIKHKKDLAKTTEALRLTYYDLAARIIKENRQVIPCYGGISNVHINYDGEVWPCCVLGYNKPLGRLRDTDYDFQKIWHSQQAREVRRSIRAKECACPLANQAYSNILCHAPSLFKTLKNLIRLKKRR